MRRLIPLALALLFFAPASGEAQPRFLVSGGFTGPMGDLSDVADAGYHGQVGLFVQLPTIPVGLRGDGAVHKLGSGDALLADTQILAGSLSVVYHLPGISLVPYFLVGIGSYQTESGPAGAAAKTTDAGFHGGFGVNFGTGGLGAFAEIRLVQINGDPGSTRFIPLSFGLRL
ncbi:MAG: porin family protein [Gemmatimonadota bacterium]|nr:porin family protein [Gemmatimonadota bacterium]